jgi:hypothetical protein
MKKNHNYTELKPEKKKKEIRNANELLQYVVNEY